MREIKFRGKRIDNGEWVYGYLLYKKTLLGETALIVEKFISTIDFADDKEERGIVIDADLAESGWKQIDPKTVGQYTGLKDKNGKEIYEGDIVRFTRKNVFNAKGLIIGVIEYHPDRLAYIVSNCIVRQPDGEKEKWDYTFLSEDGLEVIGNIYDNPELLED